MLTRQSMIALAAAIVLGLFAVYIANAYLTGREKAAAVTGTTKIAVAAVPMSYGTDITPDTSSMRTVAARMPSVSSEAIDAPCPGALILAARIGSLTPIARSAKRF